MGWTYGNKPNDVMVWVREQYAVTDEANQITQRCVDAAMVNMREIYAAVEQKDKYGITTVSAGVIRIQFLREGQDGLNYPQMGYSFQSENAGPNEINCPERILKLLTPTESAWANEWRQKCRNTLERRSAARNLKIGDYIQFEEPIKFSKGGTWDIFKIESGLNQKKRLTAISGETGERIFAASIPDWQAKYAFKKLDEADLPWRQTSGMRP